MWWNSYGQVLKKINYKDSPEKRFESGLENYYKQDLAWLESSDTTPCGYVRPSYLYVYIDENNEIVAYGSVVSGGRSGTESGLEIPSDKTPLKTYAQQWVDIKSCAREYKRKMNVSSEFMFSYANYDNITRWIYQHSSEYQENKIKEQEARINELGSQLNATKNRTIPEIQATVAQHGARISWLESNVNAIMDWIKNKFSGLASKPKK